MVKHSTRDAGDATKAIFLLKVPVVPLKNGVTRKAAIMILFRKPSTMIAYATVKTEGSSDPIQLNNVSD